MSKRGHCRIRKGPLRMVQQCGSICPFPVLSEVTVGNTIELKIEDPFLFDGGSSSLKSAPVPFIRAFL